jgi:phosphotransferase system  glucose/maltose/N-acetylglucosamine-specific IIC component
MIWIVAALVVAAVVATVIWFAWDELSGGDVSFGFGPSIVGIFLIYNWQTDPYAIALGVVLLAVGLYGLYRLYHRFRRNKAKDGRPDVS